MICLSDGTLPKPGLIQHCRQSEAYYAEPEQAVTQLCLNDSVAVPVFLLDGSIPRSGHPPPPPPTSGGRIVTWNARCDWSWDDMQITYAPTNEEGGGGGERREGGGEREDYFRITETQSLVDVYQSTP